MNREFKIKSQPEVKINGILLQQDEDMMREANVLEISKKMKKKLEPWSRRNLTLMGKVLLTKTFGISLTIYLMQCFVLNLNNVKLLNSVLYKFMWNRHFNAAKAPERIKREILNKPVRLGGFGMLDIVKLDHSIKLRILGRTLMSQHPFGCTIKDKIDLASFFFPKVRANICNLTNEAVEILKNRRWQVLKNLDLRNKVKLLSVVQDTKIRDILTPLGLNSLFFFRLNTLGIKKIGQLDGRSFGQIRRLIKTVEFVPWIEASIQTTVPPPTIEERNSIWYMDKLVSISSLSTKQFRELTEDMTPVTSYKIGLHLEVDESLTWLYRIKKLSSVKHQNTILKIAHGDLYTNDRLLRFGLRDNSNCDRCGNEDSRVHRIAECPKAIELWNKLRRLNNLAPLNSDDPDLLKEVLGINEPINNELAINAELLQVLSNTLDQRINTVPADIIIKFILRKLVTLEKGQSKENIKDLLDKIGD